ncbi:ESCRT-III subunit protein snf7 [Apophysomyces ossiformis]|uniref:Vacuolar-sorting protein SNF7 n=1 Tax=Apophysomyces ossiformis TaxID=679940 RepID=A0A8H7BJ09_9FUNG|nr:ESCRT-III subunit protein snf7 [Apophysomyces ossiformis]
MNLFFGRARSKPTAKDAIYKLRETLDMLEKRQAHEQSLVDQQLKIAKANATKNKRAAMLALRKKKALESNIERMNNTRFTIETQMMAIENANVNLETMNAMRTGAEAMRNIHGSLDINKLDDIMDDIQSEMDISKELSEALARPVGEEMDEDELAAELEELEQEELDAKMLETPSPALYTPNVPTHEPARKTRVVEDEDDAELEALKAAMAM